MAVVAPKVTPADVTSRMNSEIDTVLKGPDIVKRLRDIGFCTEGAGSTAEAADFIRMQHES